jgi:ABC-type transport system substrate-binding protein
VAEAVRSQLEANIGLRTTVDVMPLAEFREAVATGTLDGLYLDGVASSLADATGFLEPLFGEAVRTTPARRARDVSELLAKAVPIADAGERAAAIGEANTAIRSAAVLVPLAHAGSVAVFRGDVAGVVVSPLGLDPLGAAVPGDRPQLVFMQADEPGGAWCADQDTPDALRLCGLVTESLYGFAPGGMTPGPVIARSCIPDDAALVWTCRLAPDRTFSDGMRVDAGDVLASFAAQWDRSLPFRAAQPDAPFAAWDALFGAALGAE